MPKRPDIEQVNKPTNKHHGNAKHLHKKYAQKKRRGPDTYGYITRKYLQKTDGRSEVDFMARSYKTRELKTTVEIKATHWNTTPENFYPELEMMDCLYVNQVI